MLTISHNLNLLNFTFKHSRSLKWCIFTAQRCVSAVYAVVVCRPVGPTHAVLYQNC